MMGSYLLFSAAGMSVMCVVGALLLLRPLRDQRRRAARLLMSRGGPQADVIDGPRRLSGAPVRMIAGIGEALILSGLISPKTLAQFEAGLAALGVYGRENAHVVLGTKLCLLISFPLVAGFLLRGAITQPAVLLMVGFTAGGVGLLLPDFFLRRRHSRYLTQVDHGLADALDLLIICSQAGFGLNAAIARVAEELHLHAPAIANEFRITVNEMAYLADSRKALLNMGARTNVEGLLRLGVTLVQSMQYGTPLVDSMRALAAETREASLIRFEARAARLGVLLTLPMVLFILPCVFLIVGGPAAIQSFHSFHAAR